MERWLLLFAYLPLMAFTAAVMRPRLRPQRYRPVAFMAGSLLCIALGVIGFLTQLKWLAKGLIDFTTRGGAHIHASLALEPAAFWITLLAFYGFSIVIAGFGAALCALCFSADRR